MYEVELEAAVINCVGCQAADGAHFSHCAECDIRECSQQTHNIANCGLCEDYPCERIRNFFEFVPPCRDVLDEIRRIDGSG